MQHSLAPHIPVSNDLLDLRVKLSRRKCTMSAWKHILAVPWMLAHVKTMFHQVLDSFVKVDLDHHHHFVLVWLAEYSFWTRRTVMDT